MRKGETVVLPFSFSSEAVKATVSYCYIAFCQALYNTKSHCYRIHSQVAFPGSGLLKPECLGDAENCINASELQPHIWATTPTPWKIFTITALGPFSYFSFCLSFWIEYSANCSCGTFHHPHFPMDIAILNSALSFIRQPRSRKQTIGNCLALLPHLFIISYRILSGLIFNRRQTQFVSISLSLVNKHAFI